MQKVALVIREDFQVMSLAALSAFEFANRSAGEPLYDIHVLSEHGGPVASSLFASVHTEPFSNAVYDTILVAGAMDRSSTPAGVVAFLREVEPRARRVGALCVGAFALAEAGLLSGRRATVHWRRAAELRRDFPQITVDEDRIFIVDGKIWTSAGMTAALDLTLGMVEKDHGAALARSVAQSLVLYHRRAGGQSQHSQLVALNPTSNRVQQALDYARRNLRKDLRSEDLANAACLSPRQFSRVFRTETGTSPAKAIENLRLESARLLVEQGRHSLDNIATETGFGDRDRMRRAFLRAFGQSPQSLRSAVEPLEESLPV
ncbi:Transcriptional regulator GlxA family, contains an amidase domain and an AraC-type DNA-binding HTH domain [Pseudomonas helmanticensis]|uniref:Transcriptional regulator GlxA family, contains an amidase domain and an AraC-type DNA-binding HTH domain n=1 Tax=Pseudomonas helmanticensis TaxID=1471381 RepID=A0ACD2U1Q2_9PSED|nr:GlxA family transcriptional regulator [Pseudomonas helmanticensis]SMQ23249.1 Transcriptional regulator GlxA family, contains an amidase domain and an AraC-type DNA-binding HTH domain [Pseudomonas helmanticensis]